MRKKKKYIYLQGQGERAWQVANIFSPSISFSFSVSLSLSLFLSLSVRQSGRGGRGATAQELNNNFQQSSQEAGGPDCSCSILSLSLPPPQPVSTLLLPLLSSPPPVGPLQSTNVFCRQAGPWLLKRQATKLHLPLE